MNFRRETGGNLAIGQRINVIQIEPAKFGDGQPHLEPQCDPIAQRFTKFTLATGERLMLCPYSLKTGYLTPIRSIVLDDFVTRHFHGHVDILRKHNGLFCFAIS